MSNPKEVYHPKWGEFQKESKHVHDWRTYIPEHLQEIWEEIAIESRLLMFEVADYAASMEHWE